jgi:hypothetical protein
MFLSSRSLQSEKETHESCSDNFMLRLRVLRLARARGSGAAAAAAAGPFDPYKILGLPPTATPDDAKRAYHKLALRFHPDAPEGNKERFQAVQEAHEAIKNGWVAGHNASGSDGSHATEGGEGGGKRYRSTYVYEEPGSTDDNYVSSNPTLQRNLQLLMLTCFVVFMLRMLMHVFGRGSTVEQKNQQPTGAPDLSGFMSSTTPRQTSSVHDEGDAEWRRYKERTSSAGDNSTGVYRFEIGGKPTNS